MNNAFREIINITENKWYDIADIGIICAYQLKSVGINFVSSIELSKILLLMVDIGFLEIHSEDSYKVKIKDHWYEYKQENIPL